MYHKNIDYDIALEQSVLGICIVEPDAYGSVHSLLGEDCFYGHDHTEVYKALAWLLKSGYPIDLHTVSRYFYDRKILAFKECGEVAYYLVSLVGGVCSSAHLEHWCLKLRELAARRMMIALRGSGYASGDVFDEAKDINDKLKKIFEVKATDDWRHISQVAIAQTREMDKRDARATPGVTTSIAVLDRLNGGFRNDDLVVLGARPGVGKSAFMGRLAVHAAYDGKRVGIISLEMDNTAIFTRMASAESETDFFRIDRNDMEERQRAHVYQSIARLSALPIYFSDTAQVSITDIRAKVDKLRRKHGIDILFIDYLQLIEPEAEKGRTRDQEVGKMSRGLKMLAKTLHIPIVLLAQLNRAVMEEKGDKKPQAHHLRESGNIEQDADVIMFLHRDYMVGITTNAMGHSTEHEADLLIRKWRNGAPTAIKIGFEPRQMRFYDIEAEHSAFKTTVKKQRDDAPF